MMKNVAPKLTRGPDEVPVFVAGVFRSSALKELALLLITTEPTEVKFLELKFTLLPVGFRVKITSTCCDRPINLYVTRRRFKNMITRSVSCVAYRTVTGRSSNR